MKRIIIALLMMSAVSTANAVTMERLSAGAGDISVDISSVKVNIIVPRPVPSKDVAIGVPPVCHSPADGCVRKIMEQARDLCGRYQYGDANRMIERYYMEVREGLALSQVMRLTRGLDDNPEYVSEEYWSYYFTSMNTSDRILINYGEINLTRLDPRTIAYIAGKIRRGGTNPLLVKYTFANRERLTWDGVKIILAATTTYGGDNCMSRNKAVEAIMNVWRDSHSRNISG